MRRWISILLILCMLPVIPVNVQADGMKEYHAGYIELTGTVVESSHEDWYEGKPFMNECTLLRLDEPIHISIDAYDGKVEMENCEEIQIGYIGESPFDVSDLVGEHVLVKGTLDRSPSGHYYGLCVIDIDSIDIVDSINGARDGTEYEDEEIKLQTEWISQHVEYAKSDRYKKQVISEFPGALGEALDDIKGNGSISSYNTLESINKVLEFDMDLNDVQEYELLLAQILFSRTGTTSIDQIYDESLSNNITFICEILIKRVIPKMTTTEIKKNSEKIKNWLETLKGLSYGDKQYSDILHEILKKFDDCDDVDFREEFTEIFNKTGFNFALEFYASEVELAERTLSEMILYMASYEAYCHTSEAFGKVLVALRKHISIPSENPVFEPFPSDEMLVNDRTIGIQLGLKNVDSSIGTDPLNTPVNLVALATAIENYYTKLETAKNNNAYTIALDTIEKFEKGTIINLIDSGINLAMEFFECLPVLEQFSVIKSFFDGTQFVIDTFTKIDDRAYLGTMVMRLYSMLYIHYLTVNDWGKDVDNWGNVLKQESLEVQFDEKIQYICASQFNEAVAVYRAILSVATDYAEKYYTMYYKITNSLLSTYPNAWPPTYPYVDSNSDTFKSIKVKIMELQMYRRNLEYEWCHSTNDVDQKQQEINEQYMSDMLIYSFKCPVTVTFKNETGESVAVLSNGKSKIADGYEYYFYASEVICDSGEYVKIAAIPSSYKVVIEGTGMGRMDVSISQYRDGQLGETKQFFEIPVSEKSKGYIANNQGDICLIINNKTYIEGDYSETELPINLENIYSMLFIIGIICMVVSSALLIILVRSGKVRK